MDQKDNSKLRQYSRYDLPLSRETPVICSYSELIF